MDEWKLMSNKDTNNLIATACAYFGSPFDDRTDDYSIFYAPHGQEPEHVTLHQVADAMKISTVKVRHQFTAICRSKTLPME